MVEPTLSSSEDDANKAARRERKLVADRAYHRANKERSRQLARAYYLANKDHLCAKARARQAAQTATKQASLYGPPAPQHILDAWDQGKAERERARQRAKQRKTSAAKKAAIYGPPIPLQVREANRKAVKQACNRRWYSTNQDAVRAKTRAAYDRQGHAIYCRAWRAKNLDRLRASARVYYHKTKGQKALVLRAYSAKRRARLLAAEGSHSASDVRSIFLAQKGRCAECGKKLGKKFHVDHIFPLSRGGSNFRRNLQILCAPCNLTKHARDPIEFAKLRGRLL